MTADRVLVTAGGAGIGQAIALAYVTTGAKVAICDVDKASLDAMRTNHRGVTACYADVSNAGDLDRLFGRLYEEWGGIDVLVNNAGIGGPRAPVEETDEAEWRQCVDVNLTGAFLAMKRAIPSMKQQRSGCIINISTSSARTGLPNRGAYVASKAGLIALSVNTAREVGPWNIRCNAILPGLIDNDRGRSLITKFADERSLPIEQAREAFLSFVSMRTMIAPAEVAELSVFLSGQGGSHITGQAIGVDGNLEWEG
ncbi:MAG: SDR family oxidoreductase [Sphingopyxis sp.]|nr:SDR family oxidoreductase [Sphingopyxis sp.]